MQISSTPRVFTLGNMSEKETQHLLQLAKAAQKAHQNGGFALTHDEWNFTFSLIRELEGKL